MKYAVEITFASKKLPAFDMEFDNTTAEQAKVLCIKRAREFGYIETIKKVVVKELSPMGYKIIKC